MKSFLTKLRRDLAAKQNIPHNRLVIGGISGPSCYFSAFAARIKKYSRAKEQAKKARQGKGYFRATVSYEQQPSSICTPMRILVADDNRTNRNILSTILESAGHTVVMVTDGDEALDVMKKGGIDILLIDVNMPRLNGIDTCSMWRQIEGGRIHLPIIGITADATSETEIKCRNVGMDMRITKPVNAQMLLNAIEKYCRADTNGPLTQQALSVDPLHEVAPSFANVPGAGAPIDKDQIQYLLSIGDHAFVNAMIEGFVEDVEQTLGPLRKTVAEGDVSEFRFCAHAFKSSGNNMGARSLSRLCGQLEKVSEADFLEHRFIYLQKMEQETATAIDALKSHVHFTPNGDTVRADSTT